MPLLSSDQEIKILKKAIKAQAKMILNYRTGNSKLPEWVFHDIDKAKKFYNVSSLSDIK